MGSKPRLLVIVENFEGWERGADCGNDLDFMISHGGKISKIAIVAEPRWETLALDSCLLFLAYSPRACCQQRNSHRSIPRRRPRTNSKHYAIKPSSNLEYGWTQSGTNSNMVQKRPGGLWEDYGVGALATGKTGLCGSRCRSFMTGVIKHQATST